jgi:hypothetical protein
MKLLTDVRLFLKLVAISFIIGFVLGVYVSGKTHATAVPEPRPMIECISFTNSAADSPSIVPVDL